MVQVIAHNITSPLGMTTDENLQNILAGKTSLCKHRHAMGLEEPFGASLFDDAQWAHIQRKGFTRFESLVIHSMQEALRQLKVTLPAKTCFILSTTKANIENLQHGSLQDILPAESAEKISRFFQLGIRPIVVSNACISGVSAQILALRLLECSYYDCAIVVGCDVQSKFIVSGFQSLKALSADVCKPFDIERLGLNLGEACGTMVLRKVENPEARDASGWYLISGNVCNDALHITNPSPIGLGCKTALMQTLANTSMEHLALINLHGTATMYNDQMESKAIEQLGLSEIPVNGLKGYFGHTMGAAGIIETIVSLSSLDKGILVGTKGFSELGVSGKINISPNPRATEKNSFVKVISGFGGCNGAVLYSKSPVFAPVSQPRHKTLHRVRITPEEILLDGRRLEGFREQGVKLLTEYYKSMIKDYPKFHKMDILGKLGIVASELLLSAEKPGNRFQERTDRAVVIFNHSSSIVSDMQYQESIEDESNFFPSPSVFIYTLPNIVTGEISIRNKYHGETALYILSGKDTTRIEQITSATFLSPNTHSMVAGWIDAESVDRFEAELALLEKV